MRAYLVQALGSCSLRDPFEGLFFVLHEWAVCHIDITGQGDRLRVLTSKPYALNYNRFIRKGTLVAIILAIALNSKSKP